MKMIKRVILSGSQLENKEMDLLLGGLLSNTNNGTPCTCEGSTNGYWYCNNNSNQANGCTCYGNENNTNKQTSCTCGTPGPA